MAKKLKKNNVDLEDPPMVSQYKNDISLENIISTKSKVQVADANYNLSTFNMSNMA